MVSCQQEYLARDGVRVQNFGTHSVVVALLHIIRSGSKIALHKGQINSLEVVFTKLTYGAIHSRPLKESLI